MRKERIKGMVIGFVLCAMLSASVMVAANTLTVTREITYGVGVILNGQTVQFDYDSRPFVMDGRTFLPIRTLAELLGMPVDFDPATNTAIVGRRTAEPTRMPLNVAAPLFDGGGGVGTGIVRVNEVSSVEMGGNVFSNAVTYHLSNDFFREQTAFSLHNLNEQFRFLTGYFGRIDGTNMLDATLSIYGDGSLLQTYQIRAGSLPAEISVFVEGVRLLRIEVITPPPGRHNNPAGYAFAGFLE